MSEEPYISIILPVYKQADHIVNIVESYLSALGSLKHRFEIILAVNASNDDSLEVCQKLAESSPDVRVLYDPKPGWGRSVRSGLAAARGQIITYTNSARTTPHNLLSLILLAIANPGCVIKATRKLRYPILRRIGSGIYNLQCRALFNLAVWDVNGTPKVFSQDLLDSLDLEENGDLIDLEFIVKCIRKGCQILDVPIVSSERHGGAPTTNLISAVKMYWGAFRIWRSWRKQHPVRAQTENS